MVQLRHRETAALVLHHLLLEARLRALEVVGEDRMEEM